MYTCPNCTHNGWRVTRTHTVYEDIWVHDVQADGTYTEDGNDFGDTESTGAIFDIRCEECDLDAPADHPLWPTKEA